MEDNQNYAKKQYQMAKISAVCSVCMLVIVVFCAITIIPKFLRTLQEMNTALEEMEVVVGNLEEVSGELAQADISGMLDNVNGLVDSSQEGVAEAMEKVSALDIETMNEAIRDLKTIVAPLADLVNNLKETTGKWGF